MSDRLLDKVCIVTGGAQGIGAAYARALAAEGADVAVVDLKRIDQAKDVQQDVEAMGRRCLVLKADVSDEAEMQEMGQTVIDTLGRVDCLVNNAGLMFDQLTATWDDFLAVNFMGIINASNAVIPAMWEQRSGSIVNISSTAAFPLPLPALFEIADDAPPPHIAPEGYGMTKWMIIHHTRRMAQILGKRNIRANSVCPGVTMSPATKAVVPAPIIDALAEAAVLGTTLEPEDMTGVVVFLASDDSSKMTGQVLINDAGTWFSGVSYHPDLRVERDGHVTTVTIDRPASKNACTGDMWVALGATFRDISWSGARAVVLTGAGGDFCAGADLGGGGGNGGDGGGGRRVPGNQLDAMRVLGDVVLAVHQCPVPVIAKVDGVAVGAGFGLALAADVTWCSDRARFSAIFAKRGLSLDFGTSWLLRQRVGVHVAKQLAFTAEMVSGERALELGLVNAVTPVSELDDAVAAVAATIAAGPPIALSMTKRELDNAGSGSLAQALEAEALAQNVNTRTDDMAEAMTAYMERRPPNFRGQ